MQNLIHRLGKRGWSKKEIAKAVKIINSAKQSKTKDLIFVEKRIYWILLILIIAANFTISAALVPVLIALKGMSLYFVIIVLGVVFGLLFELVIRSIEHLEKKHHIFLVILIPLVALINAFVMSNISNSIENTLNLSNAHNSLIVALVYAISFVSPYVIYRFVLKIEYYSKE